MRCSVGGLTLAGGHRQFRPARISAGDEAIAVIRTIPRQSGNPWLFPGHAPGKPLSDLYLFWNRLRRSMGLADVRIHDLRHTFASFLVNAGHSLYEVQKLLGHSDPRTTMRYAHLEQASLVAVAETVSVFLARPGREIPESTRVGLLFLVRMELTKDAGQVLQHDNGWR